jgi:hypothetical protein
MNKHTNTQTNKPKSRQAALGDLSDSERQRPVDFVRAADEPPLGHGGQGACARPSAGFSTTGLPVRFRCACALLAGSLSFAPVPETSLQCPTVPCDCRRAVRVAFRASRLSVVLSGTSSTTARDSAAIRSVRLTASGSRCGKVGTTLLAPVRRTGEVLKVLDRDSARLIALKRIPLTQHSRETVSAMAEEVRRRESPHG